MLTWQIIIEMITYITSNGIMLVIAAYSSFEQFRFSTLTFFVLFESLGEFL